MRGEALRVATAVDFSLVRARRSTRCLSTRSARQTEIDVEGVRVNKSENVNEWCASSRRKIVTFFFPLYTVFFVHGHATSNVIKVSCIHGSFRYSPRSCVIPSLPSRIVNEDDRTEDDKQQKTREGSVNVFVTNVASLMELLQSTICNF